MREKIIDLYKRWTDLNPISFIIITSLLMIVLTLPVGIVFEILEISDNEIGGVDFDKYGIIGMIFMALILAPLLETLLSQQIPILLSQRFIKYNPNVIGLSLSVILFSLMHISYSIWYAILMIPSGLLLAFTFLIFQKRKESSFLITSCVHSLRNLIPLILIISEKYIT
jgi:membrane protease YdiL (CAAX protease family)